MARARQRRRGYLEQLRSGSVRAVVFAGKDPLTGRLRYIRETCKTVDEAEAALTKLLRQVDQQQHPKSAITVREAVQQWLEVAELEVTTRERYEDLIRLDDRIAHERRVQRDPQAPRFPRHVRGRKWSGSVEPAVSFPSRKPRWAMSYVARTSRKYSDAAVATAVRSSREVSRSTSRKTSWWTRARSRTLILAATADRPSS